MKRTLPFAIILPAAFIMLFVMMHWLWLIPVGSMVTLALTLAAWRGKI